MGDKKSRVEQWRLDRGLTYQDIANMAGCSRQYARNLCLHGTAGVTKAIRVMAVIGDEVDIYDFISEEDRAALVRDKVLPKEVLERDLEYQI